MLELNTIDHITDPQIKRLYELLEEEDYEC
jgi:hypothetical protein